MAKLVLHIGTRKTGTTFLQSYLHENVAQLKKQGWSYPEFVEERNHLEFALLFHDKVSGIHRMRGMPDRAAINRNAQKWADQLRKHVRPNSRWIITSEMFSTRLQTVGEVQNAVTFLRQFFDDITVVLFVRRQEFMFPSVYSQSVKNGFSPTWSWGFCKKRLSKLDYQTMYERWNGANGVDEMVVVPFLESDKANADRLPEQFSEATGIKFGQDWVMPPEFHSNQSLSAEGIAFLRVVNPYIPLMRADNTSNRYQRELVIERLMELTPGPSIRPDAEIQARIIDHYKPSNQALVDALQGGRSASQAWDEWLQPPAEAPRPVDVPDISPSRVAELMVALSEPHGPVAWGRVDSKPLLVGQFARELVTERLLKRRK
ncbi:MAG: hypothetical protein WBB44_05850 [Candidatus Nanopelagicales bacterium]|nr:hypothetical protein [Candidatus Nanopelagicales bacterium]